MTADNHSVHTKDGIRCLQMETTLAVLGDGGRYPIEECQNVNLLIGFRYERQLATH